MSKDDEINNSNIVINGTKHLEEGMESNNTVTTDTLFQIFSQSNVIIILWFLGIYFVVYVLLNIFRGGDGAKTHISKWIDIVSMLFALVYLFATFFTKSDKEKSQMLSESYSWFKTYVNNPLSIIPGLFFILTLYIVIYILEIPMDSGKPVTISLVENSAWILININLICTLLRYISGISLTSFFDQTGNYLQNKASQVTGNVVAKGNTSIKVAAMPVEINEVFNIGNNMYTYDDAQSVCASFGARLATYDDIESAYNNGAEWCNYGWSEGQAAYFPTQKDTWTKLQKSERTKNACGRPGVNGGFIDNPNVRFGVNCYGKKPKPKASDLAAIANGVNIPKTPEDILLDKKIQFWKDNGDKLFKINSYNNTKWSKY